LVLIDAALVIWVAVDSVGISNENAKA